MRQIVLDTETTGLSAEGGDRIIEIGCVELVSRKLTGNNLNRNNLNRNETIAHPPPLHAWRRLMACLRRSLSDRVLL